MPRQTSGSGRGSHPHGARRMSSSPTWCYFFSILCSCWPSFFIALGKLEPSGQASELFFSSPLRLPMDILCLFPTPWPTSLHDDGLQPYAAGLPLRCWPLSPACPHFAGLPSSLSSSLFSSYLRHSHPSPVQAELLFFPFMWLRILLYLQIIFFSFFLLPHTLLGEGGMGG